MPIRVSSVALELLRDEQAFRKKLTYPVLVWEAPEEGLPSEDDELMLTATSGSQGPATPRATDPLVYPVRRRPTPTRKNTFLMGVTVGRTETNDIAIEHISISRFHAYFLRDERSSAWELVDAESKNGTWVESARLPKNERTAVADQATVRFGTVSLLFFLPKSFERYLREQVHK